jgi:hypothetical protein
MSVQWARRARLPGVRRAMWALSVGRSSSASPLECTSRAAPTCTQDRAEPGTHPHGPWSEIAFPRSRPEIAFPRLRPLDPPDRRRSPQCKRASASTAIGSASAHVCAHCRRAAAALLGGNVLDVRGVAGRSMLRSIVDKRRARTARGSFVLFWGYTRASVSSGRGNVKKNAVP